MTAENMPLQGNFFVKSEETATESNSLQSKNKSNDSALSEDELIKDGQLRPRTRQKTLRENNGLEENPSSPEEDGPNWSHHNLVKKTELTPVLRHYVELKVQNPGRILLYRLGDFFECFFEDAILLSEILELTLTGKEGGKTIGRVPMAGIPHHAAERYCSILIQKGLSVAICDQLESIHNKEGKLIKRGITRVLTPGTVIEEGMLPAKRNNWLAAISVESNQNNSDYKWGLASADISTGEFKVQEGEGISNLEQELLNIEASEIICEEVGNKVFETWNSKNINLNQQSKTSFSVAESKAILRKHYKLKTIAGLGLEELELALRASGGLISYLNETNPLIKTEKKPISSKVQLEFPRIKSSGESLLIDAQTRRNLEITKTQRDGQFQGSFLWAIDRTLTSMGGRCLRQWIDNPLITASEILNRQNVITVLVKERALRKNLRNLLRTMGDLERLSGRASAGHAGAREIMAIADSLRKLPRLSANIKNISTTLPEWFAELEKIDPKLINLSNNIKNILIDNPPLSITEGNIIHDGIDLVLDGLRNQLDDQEKWLSNQELKERRISGNNNLRLQHHRTFGYFLSVSKSKSAEVPSHWIRRQTLSNEERFVTPDLKSREGKIFQLKLKSANREYELFCNLRDNVGKSANIIRKIAKSIAGLDVLLGLADLAATNNYCAPTILDNTLSRQIKIKGSRHPVVEQMLVEEDFEPNDINLGQNQDLIILTGPNASGKSCYLRQIGLIQLLSQIGSWIPAEEAYISIADRIFTRVGAVDDLAAGQSTFIVEMTETAYILNQATEKSLVLLDEIGRGTSTFDGLSIAWSVSEFLADDIKSRTIFATHYHELNDLSNKMGNVANFQVLVKETPEKLTFLHKVVPGGSDKSYGIEAARLAGIPSNVITKARAVLNKLEERKKF
ncbi:MULTISPECIES: DNA mismatch repair protein MutS [unclassified Prochlorococcus]|uniref:DNA mismatch repair protein MutS n=1 Tax=unclassified Prochlorococcus TaxID=2627481 RepID=UPI000533B5AD|nr:MULTISPECIES: DNA mismatch repair protein MutS [unclassified Prochlorococcus]KGG14579.1 DNA mismatch repair protein MutS [Prochlorococcus sp. MIT 0602]KGG15994.1 DNA mismatch repair protein MutS [Prochlorococcus sp. MIT 0603]